MRIKYYLWTLAIAAAALLSTATADAREWDIVGPRALGMGGAGVAVANDSTAAYWNPAAYGFFKGGASGILQDDYGRRSGSAVLSAGAAAQVHEDLAEQLNVIANYDFTTLDNGVIAAASVPDFIGLVDKLKTFSDNDARALTIRVNSELSGQYSHYGAGIWARGSISAKGDLDLVNIAPDNTTGFTMADFTDPAAYSCTGCSATTTNFTAADVTSLTNTLATYGITGAAATNFINAMDYGIEQAALGGYAVPSDIVTQIETVLGVANSAAGGNPLSTNTSALLYKGLATIEIPITFGHAINDNFAVGTNLKYMNGRTYNASVQVFNTDFRTALDNARDNYKISSNFGVDLGALYRLGDMMRVGVVARNVNSPSFEMTSIPENPETSLKEEAQIRAGVAIKPVGFLTLAADLDLTKNDTTISNDYQSRNLGVGAEVDLLRTLKLRGGAYRNLAESDIGLVYTAGVGLKLIAVQVDLGVALSSGWSDIDGRSVPEEARAELAISALW